MIDGYGDNQIHAKAFKQQVKGLGTLYFRDQNYNGQYDGGEPIQWLKEHSVKYSPLYTTDIQLNELGKDFVDGIIKDKALVINAGYFVDLADLRDPVLLARVAYDMGDEPLVIFGTEDRGLTRIYLKDSLESSLAEYVANERLSLLFRLKANGTFNPKTDPYIAVSQNVGLQVIDFHGQKVQLTINKIDDVLLLNKDEKDPSASEMGLEDQKLIAASARAKKVKVVITFSPQ